MEHHLLPTNPFPVPEIRVPCICSPPYYDGESGAFITYPRGKQKPWLVAADLDKLMNQVIRYMLHFHPSTAELAIFYQQWLFFGFLKEFLRDIFNANDFVCEEAGAKFLTTIKLPSKIHEACDRYIVTQPLDEERFEHFRQCIHVIYVVVSSTQRNVGPPPLFDWRIMLSITSTAQMIAVSIRLAIIQKKIVHESFSMPTNAVTFPNDDVELEMKKAGWCPSELSAIKSKFATIQSLMVCSRMDRSRLKRSHENCTKKRCEWYQINPKVVYEVKHREAACQCKCFQSDKMDTGIQDILLRTHSGLPVLDISGKGESLSIKVVETTFDTEYIAISHIWADGMGNPRANSLPTCQLVYLRKLADDIEKKRSSSTEGKKLYLWIDTLCCPWKPSQAKNNAIMRLRETYTKATYVLVLDAGLQLLTLSTLPSWEAVLWIFCSAWTSRLWTIQEGVLPKCLLFQFKDRSENFNDVKESAWKEATSSSRVLDIITDMVSEIRWLNMFRAPQATSWQKLGLIFEALVNVDFALQHRSVSVAADEALCISTLMDLPIKELLKVPEAAEDRMCKLWELIDKKYNGIPIGILVIGYPRLEREGFRWAPGTFLDKPDKFHLLRHWLVPSLGRISFSRAAAGLCVPNGLLVKCAGFVVMRRSWNDGLQSNPWKSMGYSWKELTSTTFWDKNTGNFYRFTCHDDVARAMSGEKGSKYNYFDIASCAILTMTAFDQQQTCDALLGIMEDLGNGKHKITRSYPVTLAKQDPGFGLLLRTAEEIACSARLEQCTRRMDQLQRSGDEGSEEFRILTEDFRTFIKASTAQKLEEKAIKEALESSVLNLKSHHLSVMAIDWFWNDYIGESFGSEKEWIVD